MNPEIVTTAPPPVALGFVTYKPEPSFVSRLEAAHAASYRVYVFDNSPDSGLVRDACRRLSGAHYVTCGRNVGLGVGLASVCAHAYYDGFPALLFFDQDTVFDASALDYIREFYAGNPGLAATHSAIVFNAKRIGAENVAGRPAHRDVLLAISSGSLFYLGNVRRLGWHNPTYFVDCVDYEFCLNSSNHGFLVGECSTTPGFDHETEQADYSAIVFGRRRRLRRYSWARFTDYVGASTRLLSAAIRSRNGRYAYAISRSLALYLWWQIVCRMLPSPPGTR